VLYCKRHDLAFCNQHKGHCLSPNCVLAQNEDALFCSVCAGRLVPPTRFRADLDEETLENVLAVIGVTLPDPWTWRELARQVIVELKRRQA
jgi:hypothetical protein